MEEEKKENKESKCCFKNGVPVFGVVLIVLGAIFLFENIFKFSVLDNLVWDYIWPIVIILLGLKIVYKKGKK